ncbi:TPA: hypothetical protein ACRFJD_003725, partial [Elizabethkingia anophelis]
TGFASGGVTYHLELCASIQVQCRLTVLCSETRPNAKPENVICKHIQTHFIEGISQKNYLRI